MTTSNPDLPAQPLLAVLPESETPRRIDLGASCTPGERAALNAIYQRAKSIGAAGRADGPRDSGELLDEAFRSASDLGLLTELEEQVAQYLQSRVGWDAGEDD